MSNRNRAQTRTARVLIAATPEDGDHAAELTTRLGALRQTSGFELAFARCNPSRPPPADGDVLLIVVGPALLGSAFLYHEDFARWIERHRAGTARVIAIWSSRVRWQGSPLAGLPVVPELPLEDASDRAWDTVSETIGQALLALQRRLPGAATTVDVDPLHSPDYETDLACQIGERLAALHALRRQRASSRVEASIAELAARLRVGPRLHAGEFLERYRLLRPVGPPAVNEAWRALDTEEGVAVCVTVVHEPWVAEPARVQRFLQSATHQPAHPYIAPVRDAGRSNDGFVFLVTDEFARGSLSSALAQSPQREGATAPERALSPAAVLRIILEVGAGLTALHGAGFVHGRLTPGNILLSEDGTAHLAGGPLGTESPERGTLLSAPELMDGQAVPGQVSDVYSLAMTALYGLHGGPLPFWVLRDPEPLLEKLPVSAGIRSALRRAIAWSRDERTRGVEGLSSALLADPSLVREMGDLLSDAGRLREAAEVIERLLSLRPEEAVALKTRLGELYLDLDEPGRAFERLVGALRSAVDTEPIFELLRRWAEVTGSWQALAGTIRRISRRRDPSQRVRMRMELARIDQERLGDPVAASESWAQVLEDHRTPDQARIALTALASLARERGDWSAYVDASRRLRPYIPEEDRPALAQAIGEAYLRLGEPDHALWWLDRAEQGGCDVLDLADTLERIRAARDQWPQVVELMRRRAATLTPERGRRVLFQAAHIARAVQLDDLALELYTEILTQIPGHPAALRAAARIYRRAGRAAAELDALTGLCDETDAPTSDPREAAERAGELLALARRLREQGRTPQALGRVEAALRIVPHHLPSLRLAARLYLERGHLDGAKAAFRSLGGLVSGGELKALQLEAILGAAGIAWVRQRLVQAAYLFRRALDYSPDSPRAWWGMSKVALLARSGEAGEAPWLRATPGRFTAHEALARLLEGLLPYDARRAWLARSATGRAILESGEGPLRVSCGMVDLLDLTGGIGPALFARLRAYAPDWSGPIGLVERLWGGDEVDPSPAYGWASWQELEDFEPDAARRPLGAGSAPEPWLVLRDADAAMDALLASDPPAAPAPFAPPHRAALADLDVVTERPALLLRRRGEVAFALAGDRAACRLTVEADGRIRESTSGSMTLERLAGNVYLTSPEPDLRLNGAPLLPASRLVTGDRLGLGGIFFEIALRSEDARVPFSQPFAELPPMPVPPKPHATAPASPVPLGPGPDTREVLAQVLPPQTPVSSPECPVEPTRTSEPVVERAEPPVTPAAEIAAEMAAATAMEIAAERADEPAAEPTETISSAALVESQPTARLELPEAPMIELVETRPPPAVVVIPDPRPELDARPEAEPTLPMRFTLPPPPAIAEPVSLPAEPPAADVAAAGVPAAADVAAAADVPDDPDPTPAAAPEPAELPEIAPPEATPAIVEITDSEAPSESTLSPLERLTAGTPEMADPTPVIAAIPPEPLGPDGTLVVACGAESGRQIPVQTEITVGRGSDSDVAITTDSQLDALHFIVRRKSEGFVVANHSEQGTVVNGQRVEDESALPTGAVILAGRTVFTFRIS